MAGKIQPGRLGNLTPEQEGKLQEAWRELFHIFGMPLGGESSGGAQPGGKAGVHGDRKESEDHEPKKKRKSLFGRKREGEAQVSSDDPDDKYGQTLEFQQALRDNKPEDIRATMWSMVKMDHPDALVLRFLRARKWDVEKAVIMLISTMNWRMRTMHIEDQIIRSGEDVALRGTRTKDDEDFMSQYRMGKSFMHGTDKEGRPLCVVRSRLHNPGKETLLSIERYTVLMIETARFALREPVDTATLIFDMTDFGMRNMDNAPVKFMIKCFEANYPESLGAVMVHKAPWVFQGIWKLIRGWLDPVVASKIHFTNSIEELEAFVPRSNILKEFGGDDAWEYKYIEPKKGENDKLADSATREKLLLERSEVVKQYDDLTQEWLRHSPSEAAFRDLQQKRNQVAEQLRVGYWKLDPYVRARTYYDRTGVINEGGRIDFYPYRTAKNGAPATTHSPDDVD